ncbi:hypothetical protein AAMO2058_000394400 [Amorphochlora amoebiformis]
MSARLNITRQCMPPFRPPRRPCRCLSQVNVTILLVALTAISELILWRGVRVLRSCVAGADKNSAKSCGLRLRAGGQTEPLQVKYDIITGVPSEYNDLLPPKSLEYKKHQERLKRQKRYSDRDIDEDETDFHEDDGDVDDAASDEGKIRTQVAEDAAKKEKKKKKVGGPALPEVLLHLSTRVRCKSATLVTGLDGFGIKLENARRKFAKKFASACSISESTVDKKKKQIFVQGDWMEEMPRYILKEFRSHGITPRSIFEVTKAGKKKQIFPDSDDDD